MWPVVPVLLPKWPHSPHFSWDKGLRSGSLFPDRAQCWPWPTALRIFGLAVLFLVHSSFYHSGSESLPGRFLKALFLDGSRAVSLTLDLCVHFGLLLSLCGSRVSQKKIFLS